MVTCTIRIKRRNGAEPFTLVPRTFADMPHVGDEVTENREDGPGPVYRVANVRHVTTWRNERQIEAKVELDLEETA